MMRYVGERVRYDTVEWNLTMLTTTPNERLMRYALSRKLIRQTLTKCFADYSLYLVVDVSCYNYGWAII